MKKTTLWIATKNQHKVKEFRQMLDEYEIKSLLDLDTDLEIIENGTSFEQNAMIKAKALAKYINGIAIGDDSGLSVDALNGFPGIYSARWAEPITDAIQINDLLLEKMKNEQNRKASMISAIAYFDAQTKNEKYFLGSIKGTITMEPNGKNIFGYDQIFKPDGSQLTFSQMGLEKNKYSHRHLAIEQLKDYLEGREISESKN